MHLPIPRRDGIGRNGTRDEIRGVRQSIDETGFYLVFEARRRRSRPGRRSREAISQHQQQSVSRKGGKEICEEEGEHERDATHDIASATRPSSITLSPVGEMARYNATYLTPRTPTPQLHHFDNFHRAGSRVLLSCAFLKPLNRSLMLSVDD